MTIDIDEGTYATDSASTWTPGSRTWRRSQHEPAAIIASTNAMYLPGGHYHATVGLNVSSHTSEPVAYLVVIDGHRHVIAKTAVAASQPATIDFDFHNAGATSGDAMQLRVLAGDAESIEVAHITLELVERDGISPFQIFK
jgi:hypothetical protein